MGTQPSLLLRRAGGTSHNPRPQLPAAGYAGLLLLLLLAMALLLLVRLRGCGRRVWLQRVRVQEACKKDGSGRQGVGQAANLHFCRNQHYCFACPNNISCSHLHQATTSTHRRQGRGPHPPPAQRLDAPGQLPPAPPLAPA